MNENAKKFALIAVVVIAICVAAFGAKQFFGGDQMDVVKTVPPTPGFKSEKERFLEQQGKSGDSSVSKDGGARDLGGDLGGG